MNGGPNVASSSSASSPPVKGLEVNGELTIKDILILAKALQTVNMSEMVYCPTFMGESKIYIESNEVWEVRRKLGQLITSLETQARAQGAASDKDSRIIQPAGTHQGDNNWGGM